MDANEFEQTLSDAETRLDRIKALYEQWFQGLERLEPTVPRKALERLIAALRRDQPRNTALRFRFQTLQQRWNTYTTYWQRTARQIEEGTYRRDVLRARRRREEARAQRHGQSAAPEVELDIDVGNPEDMDVEAALDALDAARIPSAPAPAERPAAASAQGTTPRTAPDGPAAPARPAVSLSPFGSSARGSGAHAAARSSSGSGTTTPQGGRKRVSVYPPPTPVGGTPAATRGVPPPGRRPAGSRVPDESRIRAIYDEYLSARRQNNERTDNLRFESVAKSIRQMVPKLQKKHTGKRIDFEVVVKDGRVGLKPIARK